MYIFETVKTEKDACVLWYAYAYPANNIRSRRRSQSKAALRAFLISSKLCVFHQLRQGLLRSSFVDAFIFLEHFRESHLGAIIAQDIF